MAEVSHNRRPMKQVVPLALPHTDRFFQSNNLTLHAHQWDLGGSTTVLCLHGFLDIAYSFRWFAEALSLPCQVLALNQRGHGKSQWAPQGTPYAFSHYIVDLAYVAESLGEKVWLLGHSMGGGVASYYAALYPEHVHGLINMEGYGPPHVLAQDAPAQMRKHIDAMKKLPISSTTTYQSIDEVAARLQKSNRRLPLDKAMSLAKEGSKEVEGSYVWRFDPRHRMTFANAFQQDIALAFFQKITVPTLLLEGEKSFFAGEACAHRRAAFPNHSLQTFSETGHMIHNEQPVKMAQAVEEFIQEQSG